MIVFFIPSLFDLRVQLYYITSLWVFDLEMDSLVVSSHGSLLESFRKSGVGMASTGNVLGRGTVLNGKSSLGDHLTSVGTNDVSTENAVGLLVRKNLDKALSVEVGLGTGVGNEGELTDVVGNTGSLELLLRLADPSDLGVGVHDGGNDVVVDVTVAVLDELDGSNTLLLGLVGEHGTKSDITNDSNVGLVGAELRVHDDATLVVNLNTDLVKTKASGVGATANGNEQDIGFKSLSLTRLDVLDLNLDNIALALGRNDLGAGLEVKTLLSKNLLSLLGDLTIHTSTNGVLELNDGDLGTETGPDGTHLETNDTTTDNGKSLGDLLEGKSTGRGDNSLLVDFNAGEGSGLRASGNDNVLGLQDGVLAALNGINLDLTLAEERGSTLVVVDLVLLEKTLNTLGETVNSSGLGLLQIVEVDLHVSDLDTSVLGVVLDLVEKVGVVEQSLGGNAANVETGATERAALLNTGSLETELGGLDGGNVATGTTTNNNEVVFSSYTKCVSLVQSKWWDKVG